MGKKPLLGICLGQQAIGQVCGWSIVHACTPMHGKPSMIQHSKRGLFEGLSEPLQVGRYHSLILKSDSNGDYPAENREIIKTLSADISQNIRTDLSLQVDAQCEGEIMAVSNPEKGIWAVQFHPESVLTPEGQAMINRWLRLAQDFIRCAEI
jgi:anthranilate/para-aminobenzoate synthase component II